ncbi:cupin domain-containing protein [Pseudoalteromonas sp. SG45-5]|uniref:cupin domain-containing protein n=1 Tax=unclassified Pseudoalteromonas TaxID=194690 RepID=UPI0015FE2772|nr:MULTISPECIES: cupin domain-containing protein [unclassified Pseudoalteromonas]MBB1384417.1 cupin domain-containing protein [Pseudoalteromonas sp. SG45-5]MBB1392295.1 cupin domain-containing protein [Pseudoalteromonas sp. SG44-4]MBB1445860.1 cupin domain-containing protein [Pseudoalteromonas sp. SG41-6]
MDKVSTNSKNHYRWGNNCDGWHLVKSASLSVIQERVPKGESELRHFHRYAEQFFYILSGIATIECEDVIHKLHTHQGLHIPATKKHTLSNQQNEDLVFIVTSTPPSHGDKIFCE